MCLPPHASAALFFPYSDYLSLSQPRSTDTSTTVAWPVQVQMVVEANDQLLGLPEPAGMEIGKGKGKGNGNGQGQRQSQDQDQDQAVGGNGGISPASSTSVCEENQEGRGQQGFEGPEKTLEIEFDPEIGHEEGLRAIRREQWDAILQQVISPANSSGM